MSRAKHQFNSEQLSHLFTQLKRLEASGLPVLNAYAILIATTSPPRLKKSLLKMQQQIKAGNSIAEAGFRAGIFDDIHRTLIHAAESSGQLSAVYGQLADYYTQLHRRLQKIKSRLYVPALTLSLSFFLTPLPDFVSAHISTGQYLQQSLGRLLTVVLGVFLLIKLPKILHVLGVDAAWHRLQMRIPIVARWLIKRQINTCLYMLALLLGSGLAYSEALPKAVATIKNSYLRQQFKPALTLLKNGASVTDTLSTVPAISATTLQILKSSEQSGKLASGLLKLTQLEAESISLQDDSFAEWLPRIIYSLIVLWVGYSMISR